MEETTHKLFDNKWDLNEHEHRLLVVGEVRAGKGGERGGGWPGQEVLTLPGCLETGLGQDRDHSTTGLSTKSQLGRVGEGELVDAADCGDEDEEVTQALVHRDPGQ